MPWDCWRRSWRGHDLQLTRELNRGNLRLPNPSPILVIYHHPWSHSCGHLKGTASRHESTCVAHDASEPSEGLYINFQDSGLPGVGVCSSCGRWDKPGKFLFVKTAPCLVGVVCLGSLVSPFPLCSCVGASLSFSPPGKPLRFQKRGGCITGICFQGRSVY